MQTTTTIINEIINEVNQATNQETNAMNNETFNTEANTNQEANTMNTIDQLTNAEIAYAIEMLEALVEAEENAEVDFKAAHEELENKIEELNEKLGDIDPSDCTRHEIRKITENEIGQSDEEIRFGSFTICLSDIYERGDDNEEIESAALEMFFDNADDDDKAEYIFAAETIMNERATAQEECDVAEDAMREAQMFIENNKGFIEELKAELAKDERQTKVVMIDLTAEGKDGMTRLTMTGTDYAAMLLKMQAAISCATDTLLKNEVVEAYFIAKEFHQPAIFDKNDISFTLTLSAALTHSA